ncbi:uncharacterized protein LOC129570293 [Sitodiplosis mosellana]|uniref:uncharacterized protein LOC129570293 n=1 Tax=Sitodiplosis mosellana TaxID=263140 RepID=UPI002444C135|nr:uncharacterized protein LOC129570293 [Sitodiplosis mosellana]
MSPTFRKVAVLLVIVLILAADCDAKRKRSKKFQSKTMGVSKSPVAKELELRETNPPNFLRLLVMRLIYGIAVQMNLEERVAGWFNGAFVPPNADYDDYGFGGGLDDLDAGDIFDAK